MEDDRVDYTPNPRYRRREAPVMRIKPPPQYSLRNVFDIA